MQTISIYDLIILHQYFSSKKKPTGQDKSLAKKIDDHLTRTATNLVFMSCAPDK